ncbi:MAG: hypothetical protein KKD39_01240, partial [Candidatus Altiarchaeota archaeon]|nr:hypothetical protein [Candidatus Altiarchaeota archaeon]
FFTLLSFRFLLAGLKNKSNTWFFLAGTAMGIGFGFKQTAAILFLAIPAAVIARRHFNHGRKDSAIVGAALSFAGFIVPVMALFYFFHANSALGDFVYHVFLLNIKTNSANIGARIFDFSRVNSDILFWLPAYLCLLGDVKKIFHRTIKLERLVLVLYIAAGHISLLTSAPFPTYRLIILAVFMTLYAADYITKLFIHGRRSLAVSMVLFAVMNPILSISAYQVDLDIHGLMSPRPNGEFYDFLYGHVGENDAVFDFMGEHIYRKHAYPIWFFYDFRGNYMDMNSSEYENMPYELGKAQPKAMIDAPDKYLSRLSSENLVFLDENFRCVLESAGHRIFVPSKTVDSEMLDDGFEDFEILTSGAYVVEKKCGKIWVDNSEAGGEVYLESGPHHLEKQEIATM